MDAKERAEERRKRPGTMARLIGLREADRSFDYEFWQSLSRRNSALPRCGKWLSI